jgi:hypothetical protein
MKDARDPLYRRHRFLAKVIAYVVSLLLSRAAAAKSNDFRRQPAPLQGLTRSQCPPFWSELSRISGPIQGPLLSYETFTAFALEASFFGVLLFGRSRVPPWFYLLSTAMVALGTTLSAFWIMVNNSWMQVPVGYVVESGAFVPTDWFKIIFSPVVWVRFPSTEVQRIGFPPQRWT